MAPLTLIGMSGDTFHSLTFFFDQILSAEFNLTDRLGGKEAWRPTHFS